MIDAAYRERIERDTDNLHTLTYDHTNPIVAGQRYVFVYPDFGTPDGYPDYTAHRFHEVEVVREIDPEEYDSDPNGDGQGEKMYHVIAKDGWTGSVWQSELFPLTLDAYIAVSGG